MKHVSTYLKAASIVIAIFCAAALFTSCNVLQSPIRRNTVKPCNMNQGMVGFGPGGWGKGILKNQ